MTILSIDKTRPSELSELSEHPTHGPETAIFHGQSPKPNCPKPSESKGQPSDVGAAAIMRDLRFMGLDIQTNGVDLTIAPFSALSDELKTRLRQHKPELIVAFATVPGVYHELHAAAVRASDQAALIRIWALLKHLELRAMTAFMPGDLANDAKLHAIRSAMAVCRDRATKLPHPDSSEHFAAFDAEFAAGSIHRERLERLTERRQARGFSSLATPTSPRPRAPPRN